MCKYDVIRKPEEQDSRQMRTESRGWVTCTITFVKIERVHGSHTDIHSSQYSALLTDGGAQNTNLFRKTAH